MNILAIVPARGGSKGIPGKNLAICFGKPLIEWTLDAIRESELVTSQCISTDSPDIRFYANGWGHEIHPPISDDAQIEERLDFDIQAHDANIVVLLQPTSPVRTGRQIDGAIEQLCREGADSLLSVVPSHDFLWKDMGCQGGSHPVAGYDYEHRPNRQSMMASYAENGSIYVFTRDHWERTHNRLGGKISLFVMPEECRVQVDTQFDLWMAGKILERQHALIAGNVW